RAPCCRGSADQGDAASALGAGRPCRSRPAAGGAAEPAAPATQTAATGPSATAQGTPLPPNAARRLLRAGGPRPPAPTAAPTPPAAPPDAPASPGPAPRAEEPPTGRRSTGPAPP